MSPLQIKVATGNMSEEEKEKTMKQGRDIMPEKIKQSLERKTINNPSKCKGSVGPAFGSHLMMSAGIYMID